MNINKTSIFVGIPTRLPEELCQTLFTSPSIRIERIVSKGHCSAENFWYDQDQDEWVMLIQGQARLAYADGSFMTLTAGDYLLIPAHCKHRVEWTTPAMETIWLAIFIAKN
jgi:cupin 2 domain-containing protein